MKEILKKVKRVSIGSGAALIVLIVVFGCYYKVDEQEAAVVTMFGNVVRTDTAGLYFKIPLL